jgi:probable addiction module antidote protein
MAKPKLRRWDVQRYLNDEADLAAYLDAALEDGDPELLAAVLDDIAQAKRRLGIRPD